MKTLITVVAIVIMGAATSFASDAKVSAKDDQALKSLVVMIEKDMAPCADTDNKKSDACDTATAVMDKHIMTAAKQDQDKYWDLLAKADKVFLDRAETAMQELKSAPRAETVKDQKGKMEKLHHWFTAKMASIKLRTLLLEKIEKTGKDFLKEIEGSDSQHDLMMKALFPPSSETR